MHVTRPVGGLTRILTTNGVELYIYRALIECVKPGLLIAFLMHEWTIIVKPSSMQTYAVSLDATK